jgi:nitrate/nitrite-specific signal transduction histidine kinase
MNTSISSSANPTENRRFGFWAKLALSRKLLLAFGILFIMAASIAAITLWGLNRTQTTYERMLAQGVEIHTLSDQLTINLLQARRAEKNFIMRWQSEGFDTAYENYITLTPVELGTRGPTFLMNVASMRELIKQLAPFGPVAAMVSTGDTTQVQYEADIATLTQDIDSYEQSFTALITAMQQKGANEATGLEANMQNAAHSIEIHVSGVAGLEQLDVTYLQMRRNEKDYIARREQQYIDNVHTLTSALKDQIAATDLLTPEVKTELRTQADNYLTAFDALVETDKEIDTYNANMITAGRAVEALVAKFGTLGNQLAADGINTARTNSTQTFTVSIVTVAIVLVLSIFLAIGLSRQLTRPFSQLTHIAEQITSGNFETHAEVTSADEIGVLAQTFNTMTARLQVAFDDVRRRSLAVQTSAEVSRRLSMATNPRQLAVEVVEQVQSAFHYYHAHIYFLEEATGDLIMAGGTGDAGAAMLASGHRVPKGRGLVGRAADTNAPVLVSDVSQSDGWLPNPLLPETKSEAAIPISVGAQVLGVLDVQQNQVNGLTEDDVILLQSIAGQVAISLQNARSYDQSRAEAELESLVNSIGQKIQRTATVEETLQTAIREIGVALGAQRVKASISRHSETNNSGNN